MYSVLKGSESLGPLTLMFVTSLSLLPFAAFPQVMLLPGSRFGLNYVSIFRLLCQAIADPKERVKAGGLEGMAVLARYAWLSL